MSFDDDMTAAEPNEAGVSRRHALKRAGVVGGVVVAAPLIQSVTAPAYAVISGQPTAVAPVITFSPPTGNVNKNANWTLTVTVNQAPSYPVPTGTVTLSFSGGVGFQGANPGAVTLNSSGVATFSIKNPNTTAQQTITASFNSSGASSAYYTNTSNSLVYTPVL